MKPFQGKVSDDIPNHKLIYVNFNVKTNMKKRVPIRDRFRAMGFDLVRRNSSKAFWNDILASKFVLSPPGKNLNNYT